MKIFITEELSGPALDAAVARAIGATWPHTLPYSTNWDLLGPLMEQYHVGVFYDDREAAWCATIVDMETGSEIGRVHV